MTQPQCSNPYCRRTSPGDGPTCRWHIRNYGTEEKPRNVLLCNACKINFDQGKYCPYCTQIYREKDPDSFDGKEWIGCDTEACRRWVHVECEIAAGNNLQPNCFYTCPSCKEEPCELGGGKKRGKHSPKYSRSSDTVSSGNDAAESSETLKGPPTPKEKVERRSLRVDLSKLQTSSLKRYRRMYKLREALGASKEDLIPVVAKHFAAQEVEETIILSSFAYALQKQRLPQPAYAPAAVL